MASVVKWRIYDPISESEVVFDMNPAEGGTFPNVKNITTAERTAPNAGVILWEGQDAIRETNVSGVVLTEQQYNFYNDLFNIRHQVRLTDDLGRVMWIYIKDVQWSRIRRANHPWAHQYTMTFIELDVA